MLCDICKTNKATLHIKNNINGIIIEKDICSDCFHNSTGKKEVSPLERFIQSFSDMSGFGTMPEKKCPVCGTKLSVILETLYAGCPSCYREMSDYILPSIKKVQNAIIHEGKRPIGMNADAFDEFERLKNELSRAIESENYEQAAIISARLKQLRGESNE